MSINYGTNPPAGHGPHRYLFAVHAVDTELPADEIANPTPLGFNLNFHSLVGVQSCSIRPM